MQEYCSFWYLLQSLTSYAWYAIELKIIFEPASNKSITGICIMDFSFSSINSANLFQNGQNFISFSIMGMMIVFGGLSIISIYIVLLPKILNLPKMFAAKKEIKKKKKEEEIKSPPARDSEILLAITVALHLDQTSSGSFQKITWKRDSAHESAWLTAGRVRSLAVRSHLPDRRS
jgi:Na+-transporting methylmalonyl-CoA/oxaloacetate decarboxylase gamma subunit